MPLKKGKSNATRESNIKEMIASGHAPERAAAAAYRAQREARHQRSKKVIKGRP